MAVGKPDPPVFSYKFQGIFNASVFSQLAEHTESKMIIFTSGPLQGLRLSFFLILLDKGNKPQQIRASRSELRS